jgi:aldose 1-epimerase
VRELHVGDGPLEAVLLPEAGARLHRLRAFGHDLLRTPPDPAAHLRDPFFWGAYLMAPWCNRLAAGDSTVKARTVRLTSNFPDGSAIHGQVYAIPWVAMEPGSCTVRAGSDGWPWPYAVTVMAEVRDAAVQLRWRLTNLADEPMPAGIGFHPWWRRPVQLRVAAERVYASNVSPPTEPEPVRDRFDLRTLATPSEGLDGTWTAESAPEIELAWPDLGLWATLSTSALASYVAVATPADLDAIAVEPQTHAPDGLRRLVDGRSDGLTMLPAGASLTLEVGISISRD